MRSWNGKVMVDLREFYVKDGKDLPTRKGIVVTLSSSITPLWVSNVKCVFPVALNRTGTAFPCPFWLLLLRVGGASSSLH